MPTDFPPPATWGSLLNLIPMAVLLLGAGVLRVVPGSGTNPEGGEGGYGGKGSDKGSTESALLLDTVDSVTADLARNLLETAGIPVFLDSPDFDVAELGVAAHGVLRGMSVYVPASALERSRKILDEAWGKDGEGELEADEAP